MKLIWNFPMSGYGVDNGVEGTGVDQFNNEPYENLARETIQNALDARQVKDGKARMEFHLFYTDTELLPGYKDFYTRLLNIKKSFDNSGESNDTEKTFINNAIAALEKGKKLPWLRISDYNTKGLTGAHKISEDNTAFHAFIKGSGKNVKDEFSGGSKGLGKNAIFVNSLFQTMIVSTRTIDNESASIGVAKLKSFRVKVKGEKYADYTQGTGFCVNKDSNSIKYNLPVHSLLNIEEGYVRKDDHYGTDIYIPGFVLEPDWMRHIIGETILSFMPALLNDELEITVSSEDTLTEIPINSKTIEGDVLNACNFKNKSTQKEAESIFKTLKDSKPIKNDGCKEGFEMTLYLKAEEENKASCLYTYRFPTKMKIEKRSLEEAYIPCTGVLFIQGREITSRLRSVEDATHCKWSLNRYKRTQYSRAEILEALDCIKDFVREQSLNFGDQNSDEETDFDWGKNNGWVCQEETGTLSAVNNDDSGLPTDEVKYFLRDDPATHKKRRKPLKKKATVEEENGDVETWKATTGIASEDGETDVSHPTGHNLISGNDYHPGDDIEKGDQSTDGKKMMAKVSMKVAKSKMPAINPEKGWFRLYFTSAKSGENAEIEITKVGINGDEEPVRIKSATYEEEDIDFAKNKLFLSSLRKNKEYVIDLTLDVTENYKWGVNIYAED